MTNTLTSMPDCLSLPSGYAFLATPSRTSCTRLTGVWSSCALLALRKNREMVSLMRGFSCLAHQSCDHTLRSSMTSSVVESSSSKFVGSFWKRSMPGLDWLSEEHSDMIFLFIISWSGNSSIATILPSCWPMSDEKPLTTTIDLSIGSSMGPRYSLTNVCAPRLVGYTKMSVPLSGDNSTNLSTNNEGPLVVNISANSFLLVGGI